MDRYQELDYFKTSINLSLYMQGYGYSQDDKKSSKNNIVMKDGSNSLVVSINKNTGHWQYFHSQDDTDRGTIIEFIQKRSTLNIGQVRVELRKYSNMYKPEPTRHIQSERKIDIAKINRFLNHTKQCVQNDYLESRGIKRDTISSKLFDGKIKHGYKGAVIFPHFDENGYCSYEVNNDGFKHFPDIGEKGLWTSKVPVFFKEIVFAESPIECLSYFQYFGKPTNILLVTGSGNWSSKADQLILKMVEKYKSVRIKAAFNNDKGGLIQFDRLSKLLKDKKIVEKCFPGEPGDDWNKLIINQEK